ncbi:hypothetical protein ABT297_30295 [Dactylosporangium sp. NPDC000555]|uniref:hypothetical protein n=1 Tax=Dactylosporangium sp. NPDC000555 TaxID=3154260 RepID=UPI00331F1480
MRALTVAIVLMLVAGCSDPVQQPGATRWTPPGTQAPGDARWPDRVQVDHDSGTLAAPGFNALVDSAAPGWASAPDTTAAELLALNNGFDGPVEVYLHQETDKGEAVVTVTLTRLGDDSVKAMRYRVVFDRGDDGRYRFVSGKRTTRCQSGRGHQTFETSLCS